MNTSSFLVYVLLLYKNKILLLSADVREPRYRGETVWGLLSWKSTAPTPSTHAVSNNVKAITKLSLDNVKLLSHDEVTGDTYYYGRLSDDQVNRIERREGQILQFYTLPEIETLSLTAPTNEFFQSYRPMIQPLLSV